MYFLSRTFEDTGPAVWARSLSDVELKSIGVDIIFEEGCDYLGIGLA
jgi:hypothetical protein